MKTDPNIRSFRNRFSENKIARISFQLLLLLYLAATFCEFIAPYPVDYRNPDFHQAPPQPIRFFSENGFQLRPFVYPLTGTRDPETRRKIYSENRNETVPIRLLVHGQRYRFWGLFETDLHLFGTGNNQTLFLLGTDSFGRDLFSRILHGARISLTIGLVGMILSFGTGLTIGSLSGFLGGRIDLGIQRLIEILQSVPAIPLWMALSAALPADWSPLRIYLGITLVLSFIGWTGLAREVRGKVLSLRQEDFVAAAIVSGAGNGRILLRHLSPLLMSHIIASLTLAVPAMILAETALSFLGLGLRPPTTSWGVLLAETQNIEAISLHPWLLSPVVFVVLTVAAFHFLGDALREKSVFPLPRNRQKVSKTGKSV